MNSLPFCHLPLTVHVAVHVHVAYYYLVLGYLELVYYAAVKGYTLTPSSCTAVSKHSLSDIFLPVQIWDLKL